VYTDFSKAFDKVRLDKMSTNVEPFCCQWLGSYFSDITQPVRIDDCVSRVILVTSGVPQGSHLGPLCFIWFVIEIARIFGHVRVLFYVDDMKLLLSECGFRDSLKIQNSFAENIDVTVGRALAMLRFLKRLSYEFRDPYTLKTLYVSRVRLKLEHTPVVCGGLYMAHTSIECVCR
jgi:hypothetical protein